jgi:myo-inositol-hexaphosphate 3-phosphohydrolase
MCIKVEREIHFPKPFPAWKAIRLPYTGPYSQTVIVRGKWMKAKREPYRKSPSALWGFCVFRTKSNAEYYALSTRTKSNAEYYALSTGATRIEKVECKGKVYQGKTKGLDAAKELDAAYVEYIKFAPREKK